MRPILRPGLHLLRRDSQTLQVGLDPTERVLVPDTRDTRRLVMDPGQARTTLGPLLLDDDARLRGSLSVETDSADDAWLRAAAAAATCAGTPPAEPGTVIRVHPFGGRLSELVAADLRTVLRRAGLPAPQRLASGPPREGRARREVHVVCGLGEPPRTRLDQRMADSVTHLLLRFVEGRALVGPLVVPGVTACLRCLDLHRTDVDPAWPLLVEQYSRLTRQDRADGVPEPLDAALAHVAMGWATRELAAHLCGGTPVTRSRVLTLSSDLTEVAVQECPPRSDCGCLHR